MTRILFEHIHIEESGDKLVDLSTCDFVLDTQYFDQGLSSTNKMYLRESVVNKLLHIQSKLGGLKFKIWDGFRPREVQNTIYKKFWNELREKNPNWDDKKLKDEVTIFVTIATDIKRTPPHSTGGAVDLTLVDKKGKELDMGTGFDHFGPRAFSLYFEENDINEEIRKNRAVLREAMQAEDFRIDLSEWWHYDYGDQVWAAELNRPYAIYGEAVTP